VRYHLILLFKLQSAARVYVLIFQQLGVSLNVVFFIEILVHNLALCLLIKRIVIRKIIKKGL
jgi:hypothetical protein